MALTQKGDAERSGYERFAVRLAYDTSELPEIARLTTVGDVIPEEFVLVWEREAGQPWQRYVSGSRAFGRVKTTSPVAGVEGEHKSRLLYEPELRALRGWATLMPGLHLAIEKAQESLPE